MTRAAPTRLATAILLVAASAAGAVDNPIPYPHPVITEMLYNPPPAGVGGGDANQDGDRSGVGDEFVELVNPHTKPIDVGGYSVSDDHPEVRYRLSFIIPAGTTLEPGQTLVIFNGYKMLDSMPGPYGDKRTRAAGPNPAFHGAIVYSIKNISGARAWANAGDMVVLRDPDGHAIDAVVWGRPDADVPEDVLRLQRVEPDTPMSYQRLGPWGIMLPHTDIDGRFYSPGEVPTAIVPPAP